MNLADRCRLAARCSLRAAAHLELGHTQKALDLLEFARAELAKEQADDYAEGERDGRVVELRNGRRVPNWLLERLVSDTEPRLSHEYDTRPEGLP